jgi:hypothetical protein
MPATLYPKVKKIIPDSSARARESITPLNGCGISLHRFPGETALLLRRII